MTTKNIDRFKRETEEHVKADRVVQGSYWDESEQKGCFIGCFAESNNPLFLQDEFGLPVHLVKLLESIFESLEVDAAKQFFSDIAEAVGRDGKDLTRVRWLFLEDLLRNLSPQEEVTQSVIDPVIEGMRLLGSGQDWPARAAASAAASAAAADDYYADAYYAAADATAYYAATDATAAAASTAAAAAAAATAAAAVAYYAATADATADAAAARAAADATAAAAAARAATYYAATDAATAHYAAAAAADADAAAERRRQARVILQLISQAN